MNGSDKRLMDVPCRRRRERKAAGLATFGFLALGFTAGLPAPAAQAQFFGWWSWHADEGPPPLPPRDIGRSAKPRRATGADVSHRLVPLAEIRRRASSLGLRLVATPHRQGHVYIGFGEDTQGLLHRLAFDAHEGRLIENVTSGVRAKTRPAQPASIAPPAPPHPAAPTQATKTPAPPDKPAAAAASTVTARELSPITPEPRYLATPAPRDSDADKD